MNTNTSPQPSRDQFADAYIEAEALGKKVQNAEGGLEMLAKEQANLAKISHMTRDQILEQLKKPDLQMTTANYYEAMQLKNQLMLLTPEKRRERLQTMDKQKQILLVQALRFHALVEKLDDETMESLLAAEMGSEELKASVRAKIKKSEEEKRMQELERKLFADLELLVEETGSKPLRVVKRRTA